MNKNDLRKCTIDANYIPDGDYYFHAWTQRGKVQRHPDFSYGDTTFYQTFGIVEQIETGKVYEVDADDITFIS
jgi:hypothetical protein